MAEQVLRETMPEMVEKCEAEYKPHESATFVFDYESVMRSGADFSKMRASRSGKRRRRNSEYCPQVGPYPPDMDEESEQWKKVESEAKPGPIPTKYYEKYGSVAAAMKEKRAKKIDATKEEEKKEQPSAEELAENSDPIILEVPDVSLGESCVSEE